MKIPITLALLTMAVLLFFPQNIQAQEECYNCHIGEDDPVLKAPAEEIALGGHRNISCIDCHFFESTLEESESYLKDHGGIPRSLSSSQNIIACALRCHENTVPFIHGKGVRVEEDADLIGELPVVCTSCHEEHATLDSLNISSWTHRVNIPDTCGGRDGMLCHASEEVAEKYEILNAYPGYLETGHGRMQALDYSKGAVCVDCHAPNGTSHSSIVEKENEISPINQGNREATCTQEGCHIGRNLKVFPGSMHGRSELLILGVPIESFIDLFYTTLILIFVGGAGIFIGLDLSRRRG